MGIQPIRIASASGTADPAGIRSKAIGLAMGTAELLGGVVAPFAAGNAADAFGLAAPLWLCLGFAIIAGLLALMLEETAPMVRHKRNI